MFAFVGGRLQVYHNHDDAAQSRMGFSTDAREIRGGRWNDLRIMPFMNLFQRLSRKPRTSDGKIAVRLDELHELPERLHLRRLLRHLEVDCVFDVGANAGQYASMLRTKAEYNGRIISFEPIPNMAEELRRLSASDDLWTIEELALAGRNGRSPFNVMASHQFSSLRAPDHDKTDLFTEMNVPIHRIMVATETLFSAFTRLKTEFGFERPFLKMDAQGFEVEIFRSGASAIDAFVGLQSELSITTIYQEAPDFQEALSAYKEADFELSALVPNNAGHFPKLLEIDCIMVRRDLI